MAKYEYKDMQDDLLKHQVFIQRLQGTQESNIKDSLQGLKKRALSAISNGMRGDDLKQTLREAMGSLKGTVMDNMTDLAAYESKFSAKVFSKYLDKQIEPVDPQTLQKALKTTNMSVNYLTGGPKRSLDAAYSLFGNKKADEIASLIEKGKNGKLSNNQIARNVHNMINGQHAAQAKSLAKTTVNFSTSLGRMSTMEENKEDLGGSYSWNATLENSCDDCTDYDGGTYDIGGDGEQPPLHYNCACHVEPTEANPMQTPPPIMDNNTFNQVDLNQGLDQGE